MQKPLVSVIIPARNTGAVIAETLQSVSGQSYRFLEIIVVDDGSTDSTPGVLQSFADSRMKTLRTDGLGASAARNVGMQHAQGELIQFLDSDDILSSDKIEKQVEALSRLQGDCIASCAWARFESHSRHMQVEPQTVWTEPDPLRWLQQSLCGGGMMANSSWLTPRKIINAAGPWNESLSLHDDGEFFTRVLLRSEQQIFVPGPTVGYRSVASSLSRRRNRLAIDSAFRVCQLRHQQLLAVDRSAETRRAISTQYLQFAYEFSKVAPDLTFEALKSISELDAVPAMVVGGSVFRVLARVFGSATAIWIRSFCQNRF